MFNFLVYFSPDIYSGGRTDSWSCSFVRCSKQQWPVWSPKGYRSLCQRLSWGWETKTVSFISALNPSPIRQCYCYLLLSWINNFLQLVWLALTSFWYTLYRLSRLPQTARPSTYDCQDLDLYSRQGAILSNLTWPTDSRRQSSVYFGTFSNLANLMAIFRVARNYKFLSSSLANFQLESYSDYLTAMWMPNHQLFATMSLTTLCCQRLFCFALS